MLQLSMKPEGIGTIDIATTALLMIDMQVRLQLCILFHRYRYFLLFFSTQPWIVVLSVA
jgi:hypothetical protein